MLLVSHAGHQTPAHPSRDVDEGALESDTTDTVDEAEGVASGVAEGEVEIEVVAEMEVVEVEIAENPPEAELSGAEESMRPYTGEQARPPSAAATHDPNAATASHAKAERADKRGPVLLPPSNGQRGPAPYAPGLRTHMSPPAPTDQANGDTPQRAPVARPGGSARFERDRSDRGDREPLRPEVRGEVGPLIDSLRDVFVQDRTVASQGGTTRCGICYLHFPLAELEYREAEGYYVCSRCAQALGRTLLPMVRRQQKS